MKKHLLLLVSALMLISTFTAWGQSSLYNQKSQGIFENELDMAFDINDFTKLDKSYIFGGWTNFNLLANNNSSDGLIRFGLHGTAPFMYSAYASLSHSKGSVPTEIIDNNGVVNSGLNPVNVVDGTTTTTTTWYDTTIDRKYNLKQQTNINDSISFLMPLGGLRIGAIVSYLYQDSVDAPLSFDNGFVDSFVSTIKGTNINLNYSETVTNYYNLAAAGATPEPTVNYTTTTEVKALNKVTQLGLTVPIGTNDAESEYALYLSYYITKVDNSGSGSYSEGAHLDASDGQVTISDGAADLTNISSTNYFNAQYNIVLPPIFKMNTDNKLEGRIWGGLYLHGKKYEMSYTAQDYLVTSGATAVKDNTTKTTAYEGSDSKTYKGLMNFYTGGSIQHSMYLDLEPLGRFGMKPYFRLSLVSDHSSDSVMSGSTIVTKADVNGNGVFTDAADQITTTTVTVNTPADTKTLAISTSLQLPAFDRIQLREPPVFFYSG